MITNLFSLTDWNRLRVSVYGGTTRESCLVLAPLETNLSQHQTLPTRGCLLVSDLKRPLTAKMANRRRTKTCAPKTLNSWKWEHNSLEMFHLSFMLRCKKTTFKSTGFLGVKDVKHWWLHYTDITEASLPSSLYLREPLSSTCEKVLLGVGPKLTPTEAVNCLMTAQLSLSSSHPHSSASLQRPTSPPPRFREIVVWGTSWGGGGGGGSSRRDAATLFYQKSSNQHGRIILCWTGQILRGKNQYFIWINYLLDDKMSHLRNVWVNSFYYNELAQNLIFFFFTHVSFSNTVSSEADW